MFLKYRLWPRQKFNLDEVWNMGLHLCFTSSSPLPPPPLPVFQFLSAQSSHSLFRFSYLGEKKSNKHMHRLKSSICADFGRWHTLQIYWSGIYWRKLVDLSQVCRSLLLIVTTMAHRDLGYSIPRGHPNLCTVSFLLTESLGKC